jgi:hypothetical protein
LLDLQQFFEVFFLFNHRPQGDLHRSEKIFGQFGRMATRLQVSNNLFAA